MPTTVSFQSERTGPTTTSGRAAHFGVNDTWATLRARGGNFHSENQCNLHIITSSTTDQYSKLERCIQLWDASSINYLSEITSAKIRLYIFQKYNELEGEDSDNSKIVCVSSNPSSNTSLGNTDFTALGSTEFGRSVIQADLALNNWNDIDLNANGIANINIGTGVSKFGFLWGWDIDNTTDGLTWDWSADPNNLDGQQILSWYSHEGDWQGAKLEIIYDEAIIESSLSAVASSDDIVLTWELNNETKTSIRVERSNDGVSGWSEISSEAGSATTYTDVGVGYGVTRYYRVRAHDTGVGQYSGYSNIDSATTASNLVAPTNLVLTVTEQAISVAWTDTNSDEDSFTVQRRVNDGSWATVGTPASSPYDDTGLDAETYYCYRVRAERSSDGASGPWSAVSCAYTASNKPTNLRALPQYDVTGKVEVVVMWELDATRNSGVKIERSPDDAAWATVTTTDKGATFYVDSGLTADTTYYYRVSTVNPDDTSDVTSSVSVLTTITTVAGLELAFLKKINRFPRE